jgi:hypothetical protein
VPHSCGLMLSVGFSKYPIRIQLTMKPATTSREKRAAFSSPLLFYIIVGIVVAAIALFLIFHPNPTGNSNSGPKTISSALLLPTPLRVSELIFSKRGLLCVL